MNKNFCNLEAENKEKIISDQLEISANEKVDIFEISSENLNISQEKIKTNSEILLILIKSSEENLASFVAKMIESKFNDNSTENLKKIWKLFSQKIDYLIFLYEKIYEFNILISEKYQIKDWDKFNNFLNDYENDLIIEKKTTFSNVMKVVYSLEEWFLDDSFQKENIFKENILKIEEFIRGNMFVWDYKDNDYLKVISLITDKKIKNDKSLKNKITELFLELTLHDYYIDTELVRYLDDPDIINFKDEWYQSEKYDNTFKKIEEKIGFLESDYHCLDVKNKFLDDFIDENIHSNLDILLEFLENFSDRNSIFFKKIVDEINYFYIDNSRKNLYNYLGKYNLDWIFN